MMHAHARAPRTGSPPPLPPSPSRQSDAHSISGVSASSNGYHAPPHPAEHVTPIAEQPAEGEGEEDI